MKKENEELETRVESFIHQSFHDLKKPLALSYVNNSVTLTPIIKNHTSQGIDLPMIEKHSEKVSFLKGQKKSIASPLMDDLRVFLACESPDTIEELNLSSKNRSESLKCS